MSAGEFWLAEVRCTVAADGSVRACQRHYWSEELLRLLGREVIVRIPAREGAQAQVWLNGHYQCSPEQLLDTGFDDIEGARETYARLQELRSRALELEQASIVARKVIALIQLVDQRLEDRLTEVVTVRPSLLAGSLSRLRDLFTGARPTPEHRVEHRQLELESDLGIVPGLSDLVLDHALAVFEFPETLRERVKAEIAVGHSVSPASDDAEDSAQADAPHRLCGGAK